MITLLFLAALTGLRFLWLHYNSDNSYPIAVKGVLDLRSWEALTEHSLPLRGEWEFYPGMLRFQDGVPPSAAPGMSRWIQVPSNWSFEDQPYGNANYGFGTYRLKILIDPDRGKSYGVSVSSIKSSSEVYINERLLGRSGQPAASREDYTPKDVPYSAYFNAEDKGEIELVVQAANFDNSLDGGLDRVIRFGLEDTLRKDLGFSRGMVWVACIAYAIHVLYGFVLYLVGSRDKKLIYFSLMIACMILATLMDGERLLYQWVLLPFTWGHKLMVLGILTGAYVLYQLIKDMLPELLKRRASLAYELLCGAAVLSVFILPLHTVLALLYAYLLLMFVPCLFTTVVMYRSTARIDTDSLFLLLAAVAAINSLIWLVVLNAYQIEMISYPFDLIIAMICFSAFWFKRFFRLSEESHRLADTLRQADKQKDDFLSTVAHELQNPLHGMINISQSVSERERSRLGGDSANDLQMLGKVGRRMSHILNDLLDMARLKENRISLMLRNISLHGVASSAIDTLRFMTEGKPIRLINRIPVGFPLVQADENRLNQVLFNLLHNAVKYSDAGEVSVQADIRDGWASISVADTGIGMEPEMLSRIFKPYEQASAEGASLRGGFGLGLSICKQLIEMHGGALTVRSQPNEGSVFTFTLKLGSEDSRQASAEPLIAATQLALEPDPMAWGVLILPSGKPGQSPSPDRIRLLAVDDDPVNLNVLRTIFAEENYEVFPAIDGQEALALLEYGGWDLIISDVTMPIMSGYELTARIRERYSIAELPVLLLTASNQDKDIEAGFLCGANDYVTKPVNATELRSRVRSLTNLKRSVNERLRMEAALLQAQIKPHFMINTFTAVSALSKIDTDKMDSLFEELTQYYRLGIDFQNSDQAVPLERELKLVRSYLYIQKERFGDRLQAVWEIDSDIHIHLPPLTLQPLVDNAVTHGLLKRNAGGEVRIRITDLGRTVEICVSDNGVGIEEETLAQLLDRQKGGRTGIGLLNTDRRLKQFCGSGLRVESKLGSGTSVSFTIPKMEMTPPGV
ncbi:ATP-binding protein [Cohnella boryungensis]